MKISTKFKSIHVGATSRLR